MLNISETTRFLEETNTTHHDSYFENLSEVQIIQLILCVVIFVLGVTGNLWVILLVARRPHLKTVTNIFIMNLAIADLLVNIICVPLYFEALLHPQWLLGLAICKGIGYAHGISVFASAFFLVAISIDRLTAFSDPKRHKPGLSWIHAKIIIFLVWLLVLLLAFPRLMLTNLMEGKNTQYCGQLPGISPYYYEYYFFLDELVFCFILPFLFISVSSVIVCRRYSKSVSNREDYPSANLIPDVRTNSRKLVGMSLAIVTLVFCFCWLPYYVIIIIFSCGPSEEVVNILALCSSWAILLGYSSSSMKPILYAILNDKFWEMSRSLVPTWITFVHRESQQFEVDTSVDRRATSGI